MRNRIYWAVFSVFLLALVCSCTGQISGEVYYDLNNNMQMDEGEFAAPYMSVKLYRDGEQIAQGLSIPPEGAFKFNIKPSKRANYCITIDPSYAYMFEGRLNNLAEVETDALSAFKAYKSFDTSPSTTTPSSTTTTTEDEKNSDEADKTESGGSSTQSSYVSDANAVMKIENGRFCKKILKTANYSIPVKVDFKAAISSHQARSEQECYEAEDCKIDVVMPYGCTLNEEESPLPEGLKLVSASKALSAGHTKSTGGATPEFDVASLSKESYVVSTTGEFEVGRTPLVWELSADCYGNSVTLPSVPITVIKPEKGVADVRIYQDISKVSNSEKVQLSVTAENRGTADVTDGELVVWTESGWTLDGFSVGDSSMDCRSIGTGIDCVTKIGDALKAGGKFIATATFTPSGSANELSRFSAKFKFKDDEKRDMEINAVDAMHIRTLPSSN